MGRDLVREGSGWDISLAWVDRWGGVWCVVGGIKLGDFCLVFMWDFCFLRGEGGGWEGWNLGVVG